MGATALSAITMRRRVSARSGHYAPVRLALLGVAMIAFEVALAGWLAARLREQGRSPREAWRWLPRSAITWTGVILVVRAESPTAAVALLLMVGLVAAICLIVLLARGVRGLPEFARQLRRIGEPDAWRGTKRG
jgi:ABC-type Fe3+-siderophore transport system permease subunit